MGLAPRPAGRGRARGSGRSSPCARKGDPPPGRDGDQSGDRGPCEAPRSIVLERQPDELRGQRLHVDRRGGLGGGRGPDHTGRPREKPVRHLRDPGLMGVKPPGQLGERPLSLDRCKRHFRPEGRAAGFRGRSAKISLRHRADLAPVIHSWPLFGFPGPPRSLPAPIRRREDLTSWLSPVSGFQGTPQSSDIAMWPQPGLAVDMAVRAGPCPRATRSAPGSRMIPPPVPPGSTQGLAGPDKTSPRDRERHVDDRTGPSAEELAAAIEARWPRMLRPASRAPRALPRRVAIRPSPPP